MPEPARPAGRPGVLRLPAGPGHGGPRPAVRRHRPAPGAAAALGPERRRRRAGTLLAHRPGGRGSLAAAVKPQVALYERHGSAGIAVLERTLAACRGGGRAQHRRRQARRHRLHHGRLRRRLAAGRLGAGRGLGDAEPVPGLRIAPAGLDLAAETGRGVFVLALTSNPEGASVQHVGGADSAPHAPDHAENRPRPEQPAAIRGRR